jgi:hypothetical protein
MGSVLFILGIGFVVGLALVALSEARKVIRDRER